MESGDLSLYQTSGLIATVWSRWKKGACRTALRAAMCSTRSNPINWSSRRNCDQEVWLLRVARHAFYLCCWFIGCRWRTPSIETTQPIETLQPSGTLQSNSTFWNRGCVGKTTEQTLCHCFMDNSTFNWNGMCSVEIRSFKFMAFRTAGHFFCRGRGGFQLVDAFGLRGAICQYGTQDRSHFLGKLFRRLASLWSDLARFLTFP